MIGYTSFSSRYICLAAALTFLLGTAPVATAQAPVVPAVPGTPATAAAPGSISPLAPDDAKKKVEMIELFKTGSIMFDTTDITRVNKIIAAFLSGVRTEDQPQETAETTKEDVLSEILSSLDGQDKKAVPKAHVLPSFYLSSVVIYSPTEWAVWVNGFKISNRNNKKEPPLYVDKLSDHEATFVWHPARLILPDVRSISFKNKDREQAIPLDSVTNTVTFTLKPNQTFVSGIMAIKEGKVQSITLQNKSSDAQAAAGDSNNSSSTDSQMPGSEGQFQPPPGGSPPGGAMPNMPGMPPGISVPTQQPLYQGIKNSIGSQIPAGAR